LKRDPWKQRAQGRPGAGRARGPPAEKKQAAVTTGLAEASRPSLRDGFNAYIVLFLGTPTAQKYQQYQ
jgi:hypothetical protein